MVGILVSFWETVVSGAMLVSGRVYYIYLFLDLVIHLFLWHLYVGEVFLSLERPFVMAVVNLPLQRTPPQK